MIKLCWWCKHFYYTQGDSGYSELTPGYDMDMSCGKSKWKYDSCSTTLDEFRKNIESAKDCDKFVFIGEKND